jgi:hypothetical protein
MHQQLVWRKPWENKQQWVDSMFRGRSLLADALLGYPMRC